MDFTRSSNYLQVLRPFVCGGSAALSGFSDSLCGVLARVLQVLRFTLRCLALSANLAKSLVLIGYTQVLNLALSDGLGQLSSIFSIGSLEYVC